MLYITRVRRAVSRLTEINLGPHSGHRKKNLNMSFSATFPSAAHFLFLYWRKNPRFGTLICCVSSIDCLASDFANFLDVHLGSAQRATFPSGTSTGTGQRSGRWKL